MCATACESTEQYASETHWKVFEIVYLCVLKNIFFKK